MSLRAFVCCAVFSLAAALAPVAMAQLSGEHADWDSGPEGYLLTKKERKEWKDISSDAEAKRFIDLFWARRDPNLDTPLNEFKARFEALVRYADQNFGFEGTRGALTDRGRVAILLGQPHSIEHRGPTETVSLMDDLDAGSDEVRGNAELWLYDPQRLPADLKVRGSRLMFIFFEQKAETNNYVLDRSHQDSALATSTLSRAPDVYLLHPDLNEAPKPVSVVGGTPADPTHLAWLSTTNAPLNDTARVVMEAGVADAVLRPLWVHVQLPAEAPVLDTFAGRVSRADGEVISTFQIAAKALAAGSERAYHLTFPLEMGSFRVEIAGAMGAVPQLVHAADIEVAGVPADGFWLSPMWLGLSAEQEPGVALGAAYCFGGWHLVPLVVETIPHQSELSYFGFAVRPAVAEGQSPELKLRITVKRDGKRLGSPLTIKLPLAKLAEDLYLYANMLNLGAFPEGGEYQLGFRVEDQTGQVSIEREVTVKLVD